MFPAVKLTRKQRNRLAAHRSRQKRQEEHNRLKQRVRELEMVNELLKRENERLISRPGGDAEGLLSSSDRDLIRKLTAPTRSSLATSTVSKESFSADEAQPTSLDGDPYVRRDYSDDDSSPTQDHLLSTANTSRNLTDSATASPTNVTTIETPKAMGDFKPAEDPIACACFVPPQHSGGFDDTKDVLVFPRERTAAFAADAAANHTNPTWIEEILGHQFLEHTHDPHSPSEANFFQESIGRGDVFDDQVASLSALIGNVDVPTTSNLTSSGTDFVRWQEVDWLATGLLDEAIEPVSLRTSPGCATMLSTATPPWIA